MKKILFFYLLTIPLLSCKKDDNSVNSMFVADPTLYDEFNYDGSTGGYTWQPNWRRATWTQNHTQMGVERAYTQNGFMNFIVKAGSPYLGGSIESVNEFEYGRWESRLKPSSVAGVVNAFFAIDLIDDTDDEQGVINEIDFEFTPYTFGLGSGEAHLALHCQGKSNFVVEDVALDFNPSDDFHIWTIDILPDRIVWYVDGTRLYEYVYEGVHKMDIPYQIFFNAWTYNDAWVQGPPTEDALYQVDWIKFYPIK